VIIFTISGQMRSDPTVFHGLISELFMFQIFGFPYLVNLPSWSIYVEVLFYLFLPLCLIVFNKNIVKVLIVIMVSSLIVGHSADREFQLIPFFIVGIIACEITRNSDWKYSTFIKEHARYIFLSGLILFALDIILTHPPALLWLKTMLNPIGLATSINTIRYIDLLLGFFLILTGGYNLKCRDNIALYPLTFLGVISYSLFLWHGFIITYDLPVGVDGFGKLVYTGKLPEPKGTMIYFMLYIPSLIFFSGLSYLVIERPFLKLKAKIKGKSN
jgi:peptidoglycan/LPS O-acetylase OafA/YrhL